MRITPFSFIQQNVFPVEYGPDFDTALETLVCEFFTRLEELLPIPDFKQARECHYRITKKMCGATFSLTYNNFTLSFVFFRPQQTASWISAAPAVLEEYMQCVSNGDDLKFLLQSKQCHGKLAKTTVGVFVYI